MMASLYGELSTVAMGAARVYSAARPFACATDEKRDRTNVDTVASLPNQQHGANSALISQVINVLGDSLSLDPQVTMNLGPDSELFGYLPELDSMAVATVLTALEDQFHFLIDDDEVTGDLFATVGSLAEFVAGKLPRS